LAGILSVDEEVSSRYGKLEGLRQGDFMEPSQVQDIQQLILSWETKAKRDLERAKASEEPHEQLFFLFAALMESGHAEKLRKIIGLPLPAPEST
jgi:hypothetical protein